MPKTLFIGSFPPPYGGVTVKNALLFEAISERVPLDKLDLMDVKRRDFKAIASFVKAVAGRDGVLVIGVSGDWRKRITDFMYCFNRPKLCRSLLFVMGGKVPEDAGYIERLGCYKRVFVETESMRRAFEASGAQNVSVYPNCRKRPVVPCKVRKTVRGGVRLVYFSLISEEKGAQLVIDAAKALPDCSFSFYGRIDPSYETRFKSEVNRIPNVRYLGVFDSVAGDVIKELNQYDIHLFPTMCPHEGVPGVIAETKLAGVPTIASNRGYNGELIDDGSDGLLTTRDTAEELADAIAALSDDSARLDGMKEAALDSAVRFYVDRYLDLIVSELPQEGIAQ